MADRNQSLHVLQHALGLDQCGRGKSNRNRFVCGEDSDNYQTCMDHVRSGRMMRSEPVEIFGNMYCFTVTKLGEEHVRENSGRAKAFDHG